MDIQICDLIRFRAFSSNAGRFHFDRLTNKGKCRNEWKGGLEQLSRLDIQNRLFI